jgi:hypothetical protein
MAIAPSEHLAKLCRDVARRAGNRFSLVRHSPNLLLFGPPAIVLTLVVSVVSMLIAYVVLGVHFNKYPSSSHLALVHNSDQALLVSSPATIDVGSIPAGSRCERDFYLQNLGPVPVELTEINTSCECFQIALERSLIGPGEKTKAVARIDFTHDPAFAGNLCLDAQGVARGSKLPGFIVHLQVRVR